KDKKKVYRSADLAPGNNILFAATGVTDGSLLRGVRFFGDGTRTQSLIMTRESGKVRFVDSIHVNKGPQFKVRFSGLLHGRPRPCIGVCSTTWGHPEAASFLAGEGPAFNSARTQSPFH